jgi:hypothetical protein
MKAFPTEEALVAAYWRQLAISIEAAPKSRGRSFAKYAARALQTHRRSRKAGTETLRRRAS